MGDDATSDFRFKVDVQVRFRDLDARGHVNNAVYLTYFEIARLALWAEVSGSLRLEDREMIVAEITCTYKSPALFNELLEVWVAPVAIGVDPNLNQYIFTANFLGNTVSGFQLDPNDGTLLNSQFSPFKSNVQPTAVAAIPHHGL